MGRYAMIIILALYLVLVWLLFFKLKLVRLSWLSGTLAGVIGAVILAVFVALLANLTPSGRFAVNAPVVTITPNVSGQVIALPIQPNVPLKTGAVLFQIDPSPFQYKVKQIEAQLAAAKQNVQQLKASYDQVTANVEGLTSQLAFHTKRLSSISTETAAGATTLFRLQDTQNQVDAAKAQLLAAQAAQLSAKLALDSEIYGVHTTVAQLQAQLDDAKWNLSQTTVRAPADGYATTIGLSVGDRALEHSSVLSFIVADQVKIVGMFAPNGFRAIKPGADCQTRVRRSARPDLPHNRHHRSARRRSRTDCGLRCAGSRRVDRGRRGLSGGDFRAAGDRPRVSPPRHARNCDRDLGQGGRHRTGRVDPALGQSLYGLPLSDAGEDAFSLRCDPFHRKVPSLESL